MNKKQPAYVPSMSADAVRAKTGKDWAGWFGLLDKAGAADLDHKAIAKTLADDHGVSGWWSQMITVEYERARGRRVRHETTSGFSVAVSKTIAASVSEVYKAAASAAQRKKWFPAGEFEPSSKTPDKYFRGAWNGQARLEFGFNAKSADKSQIAVQVSKLTKKAEVEAQRAIWKAAFEKLAAALAR